MSISKPKISINTYAGLDPGLKGALVVIHPGPLRVQALVRWNAIGKPRRQAINIIGSALDSHILDFSNILVAAEDVGAMPRQGLSSTHGFGLGRGITEGILYERGARFQHVTPAKWKRHLGLTGTGKTETLRRAGLILGYPLKKKDHDVADALMLAVWLLWDLAHAEAFPETYGKFGLLS